MINHTQVLNYCILCEKKQHIMSSFFLKVTFSLTSCLPVVELINVVEVTGCNATETITDGKNILNQTQRMN